MKKWLILLAVLALPIFSAAQAPVVGPSGLRWEQAETALNAPTQIRVGYFASAGATTPVQADVVAYSVATTVTGTTKQILFSALPSYPAGTVHYVKLQAVNSGGTSAWSTPTGPFGRPGPPNVPANPALVP